MAICYRNWGETMSEALTEEMVAESAGTAVAVQEPVFRPPTTFRDLMLEAYQLDLLLAMRDGEVLPEEEAAFTSVAVAVLKKVDGCCDYLESLRRDAEAIKEEEVRLAGKRRVLESRRERFTMYLHQTMAALDMKKVEGELYSLAIQQNPASVVIDDEDALPAKFLVYTMEKRVDKAALKVALRAGPVAGARLTSGTSLRLRS